MNKFLFVIIYFFSFNLGAMCVGKSYDVLLWNSSSNASLVRVNESGPEGGGAIRYLLIDFAQSKVRNFLVSSDFSPGGSETPQHVTSGECQKVVNELFQALKKLNFTIDSENLRVFECLSNRSRIVNLVPLEKKIKGDIEYSENKSNTIIISRNISCAAKCSYGKDNLPTQFKECK